MDVDVDVDVDVDCGCGLWMWFVDVVCGSWIVDVVVAAKVALVAAREYRSRIMISPMNEVLWIENTLKRYIAVLKHVDRMLFPSSGLTVFSDEFAELHE